jgi:pimeloyl-ACP methyl ester carboxylesterase
MPSASHVPDPRLPAHPIHQVPSSDGVTIALHDLGGDGPRLLLCHPTGFLGMTWAPLAAELASVAHAWAIDFRGHGDSTSPASRDFSWAGMADDVLAVVDHLGIGDDGPGQLRGAGHSMGGAALLLAEERRPGTFGSLWLYEPIAFPRAEGTEGQPTGRHPLAAAARRRRPWFPDRESAYVNFSTKPPLDTLAAAALRAYVDHGLRDHPEDDAVELKCSPDTEARVFEGGHRHTAFDQLGKVRCPVTVAAGGDSAPPAKLAALIVEALPEGRLEPHPDLTHFGPMEDPTAMAFAARSALGLG